MLKMARVDQEKIYLRSRKGSLAKEKWVSASHLGINWRIVWADETALFGRLCWPVIWCWT